MADGNRTAGLIIGILGLATALCCGGPLTGLVCLGLGIEAGYIPEDRVFSREQLSDAALDRIEAIVPLEDGETLAYYFAAGLTWEDSGSVITDRRLVAYESVDGDIRVWETDYADIDSIETIWSDSWLDDTAVLVVPDRGVSYTLLLSTEEGGDRQAVRYIETRLTEARADAPEEPD